MPWSRGRRVSTDDPVRTHRRIGRRVVRFVALRPYWIVDRLAARLDAGGSKPSGSHVYNRLLDSAGSPSKSSGARLFRGGTWDQESHLGRRPRACSGLARNISCIAGLATTTFGASSVAYLQGSRISPKLEPLVDNRNGSLANATGVSDRPGVRESLGFASPTTGASSLPSRSQRRHAAAEESFERSLLLLIVLLVLLGGLTVVAEFTVSQEAPAPLLEVPNLNGARSLEEAQEMAGESFVVEGVPVASGEPVGAVVGQAPEPGGMAGEGTTITVRVSGTQIEALPDVEGRTIEEARQSIRSRPFGLEVKTVESSSRDIGRVLLQEPKGGDGVTAEAGTYVTVTVGGGPPAAKVPDLREPRPEEANSTPGNKTGAPNDLGPAGRNVEQRPAAGTKVEPEDPVASVEEPGSNQAMVPDVVGHDTQEDFTSYDYASWPEEADQYYSQESIP